jgi:hypothetical protein
MKPQHLPLILCLFFSIFGCTKDKSDFIDFESIICITINQFVIDVFQIEGGKFYNVAPSGFLTTIDSSYLSKQTSLFSPGDIDYIFKQNRTEKFYRLDNCLKNKKLLSPKDPTLGVYSISVPLFTINNEIVIISFSYYCDGLCGFGGTYVYKKENEIWQKKITLTEWIS